MECARRLAHHVVLVGDVEHGGLDVASQQGGGAHLGAVDVADVTELDAFLLLDDLRQRLGRGATRVHGERLAVHRLPVGVLRLVDDREEPGCLELAEDPQRGLGGLDQRVRRAEADVGLAPDDRLVGEVLVGELHQLDLGAAVPHPLEGDEQREGLHGLDVAEGDPDLAFLTPARSGAVATGRESQRQHDRGDDCSETLHACLQVICSGTYQI